MTLSEDRPLRRAQADWSTAPPHASSTVPPRPVRRHRPMTTRHTLPALVLTLAIVLVGCAAGDTEGTTAAQEPADAPMAASHDDMAMDDMTEGEDAHGGEEGDDHTGDFSWGRPAEAAEAARTVEIEADDDFTFDPAAVDVAAGETVTFRVTNVGQLDHDLTLGDAEAQQTHAEQMAEMDGTDHGSAEPNAMTIPPGETVETTWTFTQPGEILIGCHVPGHYESGMRGTVTITEGT